MWRLYVRPQAECSRKRNHRAYCKYNYKHSYGHIRKRIRMGAHVGIPWAEPQGGGKVRRCLSGASSAAPASLRTTPPRRFPLSARAFWFFSAYEKNNTMIQGNGREMQKPWEERHAAAEATSRPHGAALRAATGRMRPGGRKKAGAHKRPGLRSKVSKLVYYLTSILLMFLYAANPLQRRFLNG